MNASQYVDMSDQYPVLYSITGGLATHLPSRIYEANSRNAVSVVDTSISKDEKSLLHTANQKRPIGNQACCSLQQLVATSCGSLFRNKKLLLILC